MLAELAGIGWCWRAFGIYSIKPPGVLARMTRTEGMSARVIRMLSQLVGLGSVERKNVKTDVFFSILQEVCDMNEVGNH